MNYTELAAKAYVYGFAIDFSMKQIERFTTSGIGTTKWTVNSFTGTPKLADHNSKFVSVNNDTLYTCGLADLSGGPLILNLPDMGSRYYVAQFIDVWSNNFAYLGTRSGHLAGQYFLTPPGYTGDVPAGMTQIKSPTSIAVILIRMACAGPEDVPNIKKLQEAVCFETPAGNGPLQGLPQPQAGVCEELMFFERVRTYMAAYPAAEGFREIEESFRPLGLLETGESPYQHPDDSLKADLIAGIQKGKDEIQKGIANLETKNGWRIASHMFDYNLDFFEIGTVNKPEWMIADREEAYLTRAVAAIVALWGNHGYEACYPMTWVDANGAELSGSNTYVLKLHPLPPVEAFWSLTMYALPDYYLVENPIARYSIGDRTKGIVYDEDGGITITMSHEAPADPKAKANWLPTPRGLFRPILRLYVPEDAVFNGEYIIPAIEKK